MLTVDGQTKVDTSVSEQESMSPVENRVGKAIVIVSTTAIAQEFFTKQGLRYASAMQFLQGRYIHLEGLDSDCSPTIIAISQLIRDRSSWFFLNRTFVHLETFRRR